MHKSSIKSKISSQTETISKAVFSANTKSNFTNEADFDQSSFYQFFFECAAYTCAWLTRQNLRTIRKFYFHLSFICVQCAWLFSNMLGSWFFTGLNSTFYWFEGVLHAWDCPLTIKWNHWTTLFFCIVLFLVYFRCCHDYEQGFARIALIDSGNMCCKMCFCSVRLHFFCQ